MKKQKIFLCACVACLAVVLLVAAFALQGGVVANADEPRTFSVESKTVHRGQRFTLSVFVSNNSGIDSAFLSLSYDKTVFTLVDVTRGDALASMNFTKSGSYDVFPFRVLWDSVTEDATNGKIVTFTFDSDVSASEGNYEFVIADLKTYSEGQSRPIVAGGTVTLTKGQYTAVFRNWDGETLQTKEFNDGDVPIFDGAKKPSRAADEMYVYAWDGWTADVAQNPDELIFVARFLLTPVQYQLSYYVADSQNSELKLLAEQSAICDFGSEIEFPSPSKENCTFVGWFVDSGFTQKFHQSTMPARDLELFGYFKLSVRGQAPQVKLVSADIVGGKKRVDVTISDNIGLCDLILTLDYDRTAFDFVGFERGDAFGGASFEHTNVNTPDGYNANPFKFSWTNSFNVTDNGKLLTLYFAPKSGAKGGGYPVTFTFDAASDVHYADNRGNRWLSALDIVPCTLAVGTVNSWNERTEQGLVEIGVSSDADYSADTKLAVELITDKIGIDERDNLSKNGKLLAAYSITLHADGATVDVQPGSSLTVRIKLSAEQAKAKNLRLYYVGDDGVAVQVDSKAENGYLVFETDHLSKWVIMGDVANSASSPVVAVILLSVFAAACLAYVIAVTIRMRKGKELFLGGKKGGNDE